MLKKPLLISIILSVFALPVLAQNNMSFFITSKGPGDGAALGGLEGADSHCQSLAEAAGAGGRTWRAYLSTTGPTGVNARDRIGNGPWYNAKGVKIASNVENLVDDNNLTKQTQLNEKGEVVNGRGDNPNQHDILTGSQLDGTAWEGEGDTTCSNWTSNSADGSALVGHHDRTGGGSNPTSWSTAHGSRGCGQANLERTGGAGYFYCFAID